MATTILHASYLRVGTTNAIDDETWVAREAMMMMVATMSMAWMGLMIISTVMITTLRVGLGDFSAVREEVMDVVC